jgi:lactate dehydrogenase-like 2-hydroxyacid dehydrogenase
MKVPKIVFLDASTVGYTDNLSRLSALGEFASYPVTSPEDTVMHAGNAEILITNKVLIDSHVMDSCPALKLICIAATGTNNVDLQYAKNKGIQVKNVTGYSTESVVQVTFSLLFYLLNHTRYYDEYTKSGKYFSSPVFTHFEKNFTELSGKHFGIIGLGTIGKRVAEAASGFGAKVSYYSTTGRNLANPYPHLALNELLSASDIISVHCPLTPETRNLLGYNQLKMMKKKALLLNTGRGGIVNEADLARALDEGLIAGAGLDVTEHEPPQPENPLFAIQHPEQLVITPHLAWASNESRERLIEGIINNINEFLSGKGGGS